MISTIKNQTTKLMVGFAMTLGLTLSIAPVTFLAVEGQTVPEEFILDNSDGTIHEDTTSDQFMAMGFTVTNYAVLDDDADRIFVAVIPHTMQIVEVTE